MQSRARHHVTLVSSSYWKSNPVLFYVPLPLNATLSRTLISGNHWTLWKNILPRQDIRFRRSPECRPLKYISSFGHCLFQNDPGTVPIMFPVASRLVGGRFLCLRTRDADRRSCKCKFSIGCCDGCHCRIYDIFASYRSGSRSTTCYPDIGITATGLEAESC